LDGGPVGPVIICDHPLDGDAACDVVRDGAAQEPDGGGGLLLGEDFDAAAARTVPVMRVVFGSSDTRAESPHEPGISPDIR
jgi:hypothetical protein